MQNSKWYLDSYLQEDSEKKKETAQKKFMLWEISDCQPVEYAKKVVLCDKNICTALKKTTSIV